MAWSSVWNVPALVPSPTGRIASGVRPANAGVTLATTSSLSRAVPGGLFSPSVKKITADRVELSGSRLSASVSAATWSVEAVLIRSWIGAFRPAAYSAEILRRQPSNEVTAAGLAWSWSRWQPSGYGIAVRAKATKDTVALPASRSVAMSPTRSAMSVSADANSVFVPSLAWTIESETSKTRTTSDGSSAVWAATGAGPLPP